MGKKAKTRSGKVKAQGRKVDKTELPAPPAPVNDELGSSKLLEKPKIPGVEFKALDREGYDDGGVADLTLVIDLDDSVLRRKRGENNYFAALKADLLPRVTTGKYATLSRRDQKIRLARLLFSGENANENEENINSANQEDNDPSEVYRDTVDGQEDEKTLARRKERLDSAKFALHMSTLLCEPACASLSLSELSKRYLNLYGKSGAEAALRCADKAIKIASDGFYDNDTIAIEAEKEPTIDPKYEENATYPGLAHPTTLKLKPIRVSILCLRSAYLHRGNALAAQGKDDEARQTYEKILPMLEKEPRCGRLDWERSSVYVNIGNTFSRQGDFDKANEQYDIAEKLGRDHLNFNDGQGGNKRDGLGIAIVAMRARAFALKKAGREQAGKDHLRKVLEMQLELNKENELQKAKEKELQQQEQPGPEQSTGPTS